MKKLFIILILLFSFSFVYSQPFAGRTKHKPLNKAMTKKQIKNAKEGKTFYYRNSKGQVIKRKF